MKTQNRRIKFFSPEQEKNKGSIKIIAEHQRIKDFLEIMNYLLVVKKQREYLRELK